MNLVGKRFENSRLGMDIYVYEIDGKEWFVGKDVIKTLGYSENSRPLRKWGESGAIVWEENKKKMYVKTLENTGMCVGHTSKIINNNVVFISKEGILQLISASEKLSQQQKQEWYNMFGITEVYTSRKEIEFGCMLEEALGELEIKIVPQYNVDNKYKIDFYIPKLNIAIEYDEQQHQYCEKEDIERENYIKRKLGCKFIRCDYRDSDIKNLMKVLKYVM